MAGCVAGRKGYIQLAGGWALAWEVRVVYRLAGVMIWFWGRSWCVNRGEGVMH